MFKKVISLITLVSFLLCNLGCYYTSERTLSMWRIKERHRLNTTNNKKPVKILGIITHDKTEYSFPKENPAQIIDSMIKGTTIDSIEVSLPFSDIDQALITEERIKPGAAFGIFAISISAVAGLIFGIILATKESCPFIYSYDGENYVFDAEPYGGAICEGLTRTEWCTLENLKEVDGFYKIKLTNEVNETQYTDELKLTLIDHPDSVTVVPGVNGELYCFVNPQTPIKAFNSKGKDVLSYIDRKDWIYWHSSKEDMVSAEQGELRNELILEFAKPRNADSVTLLLNACTTLWGSQMLRKFLMLAGNKVDKWYAKMNSMDTLDQDKQSWADKAQLYTMPLLVETKNGWEEKVTVIGGGPFISEDKAYSLDISDVEGDTLRIKVAPPANFWKINYCAIENKHSIPFTTQTLKAHSAIDSIGNDVKALFEKSDKKYHAMPEIGNFVELQFQAPPQKKNCKRTIIAKARGYYDIHLNAKGAPHLVTLKKIKNNPDFSIEYALKEYRKWEKSLVK